LIFAEFDHVCTFCRMIEVFLAFENGTKVQCYPARSEYSSSSLRFRNILTRIVKSNEFFIVKLSCKISNIKYQTVLLCSTLHVFIESTVSSDF
jgi:hypothetical protein